MKNFWSEFFKYLATIIGGIILGIGVGWILLPTKLSTGGFAGIATILYYCYNIPAELGIVILNVPLFLIAFKVLGFKYSMKSFIAMIAESITLGILVNITPLTNDILLASIFGGAMVGIGLAICVRAESTTGGTDLVARIIHTKRPFLNLSQILLIIDAGIIITSAIVFRDVDVALYSIVAAFIMTKIMDIILEGVDYSKAMIIISKKPQEISEYIMKEIGRGATGLFGKGMYTGEEKEILLCIVNKKEIPKLKKKIKEIDDTSFTIITTVTETIGEGFEKKSS